MNYFRNLIGGIALSFVAFVSTANAQDLRQERRTDLAVKTEQQDYTKIDFYRKKNDAYTTKKVEKPELKIPVPQKDINDPESIDVLVKSFIKGIERSIPRPVLWNAAFEQQILTQKYTMAINRHDRYDSVIAMDARAQRAAERASQIALKDLVSFLYSGEEEEEDQEKKPSQYPKWSLDAKLTLKSSRLAGIELKYGDDSQDYLVIGAKIGANVHSDRARARATAYIELNPAIGKITAQVSQFKDTERHGNLDYKQEREIHWNIFDSGFTAVYQWTEYTPESRKTIGEDGAGREERFFIGWVKEF